MFWYAFDSSSTTVNKKGMFLILQNFQSNGRQKNINGQLQNNVLSIIMGEVQGTMICPTRLGLR